VQVRFEKGADTALVQCPKDFVQQILINLIFNAAESMEAQKEITLKTRESSTLMRELVLAPASAANYVFVIVRDIGCGVPPENMPRIFEPFFTTKSLSDRRGTGLGLSMVYELAKKMQAGLAVESTVGKGSTFTLILPAVTVTSEKQLEMADIQ
jgi:two-component system cell cycle sensor histidine kinase/response regulator CckA